MDAEFIIYEGLHIVLGLLALIHNMEGVVIGVLGVEPVDGKAAAQAVAAVVHIGNGAGDVSA